MEYNDVTEKILNIYQKYPVLSFSKIGAGEPSDTVPILIFGEGKQSIVFIVRDNYAMDVVLCFFKECCSLYATNGKTHGIPIKYFYKKFSINVLILCNCEEYIQGIISNYFEFSNNIISIVDISNVKEDASNQKYYNLKYKKRTSAFITYTEIREELFSFFFK